MNSFHTVLINDTVTRKSPSDFSNTFLQPIHLGNSQWEVALTDVSFQNTLKTIGGDEKTYLSKVFIKKRQPLLNAAWHIIKLRTHTDKNGFYAKNFIHNLSERPIISCRGSLIKNDEPKSVFQRRQYRIFENVFHTIQFFYWNGKVRLHNKTGFVIHLKMNACYLFAMGFIDNTKFPFRYKDERIVLRNIQKGWTEASFPPIIVNTRRGQLIPLKPNHSKFITHDKLNNKLDLKYPDLSVDTYFQTIRKTITFYNIQPSPGTYTSGKDLEKELNKVKTFEKRYFQFKFDETNNRFSILSKNKNSTKLVLDNGLHSILGFKNNVFASNGKEYYAESEIDLLHGVKTVHVYCDVCEYIRVGNQSAPLLRTLVFNSSKYGERRENEFVHPSYVPVNKSIINSCQLQLCNDNGKVIPFEEGITTANLHFRIK